MNLVERLSGVVGDRYRVDRELGRGGMSVVFLAHDTRHRRRVAIKVLRPDLASAIGPDRFLREIAIASQLQHPHILPLHDSGAGDGLLYYVMPFVEGESLRARLARERQLPIADAVRLAREVAGALAHAHALDIVHRDIKPDNILLSGGHAMVADFGIARAVTNAAELEQLTATGVTLGTPAYMSPEQAAADATVDGRADIYSLGCVLYEMLSGEPPFTGSTAQAVLARHLLDPIPSLHTVRATVPSAVERAITRALEKVPADRFATATEFADALAAAPAGRSDALPPPWRRPVILGGGAAVMALAVWLAATSGVARLGGAIDAAELDTTAYAILPFERGQDAAATTDAEQLLGDALRRWDGVNVVDPFRVRETVARRGTAELRPDDATQVAADVGAGRYVRAEVSRIGDSLRVHATLYDTRAQGGRTLVDGSTKFAADLTDAGPKFARLADELLFRDGVPGEEDARPGTRSLPARQAFARGWRAIRAWDLAGADSGFTLATSFDPEYARAHLWLALARAWSRAEVARWRIATEQASLGRERLSPLEQAELDAIRAQSREKIGRACPLWRGAVDRFPSEFTAWYGWAECQVRDSIVVPAPGTRSGWGFRTSYHQALLAYERAFQLNPAMLRAYRAGSFEQLRRLFFTSGNVRRPGWAPSPDTTRFVADPEWDGDSLAFHPEPRASLTTAELTAPVDALDEAVRRQRQRFRNIAIAWLTEFPRSPDAMEALAVSLAMLGDRAALDTLRHARDLVADRAERVRVAGSLVWMEVALALPAKRNDLESARALADTLLQANPPASPPDPLLLAGLAALTGRGNLATRYLRDPRVPDASRGPPELRPAASSLLLYSALGGPGDSLTVLEREVRADIARIGVETRREQLTDGWLVQAATLAFPTHRFASLPALAGRDNYMLDLQLDWMNGDTAAIRHRFANLREQRAGLPPATLTLDGLVPEADLLAAIGEPAAAAAWLDPTLEALGQVAPHVLARPINAASLVRAAALRARFARDLADSTGARQWAGVVVTLWSDADSYLQPLVREMRLLAR